MENNRLDLSIADIKFRIFSDCELPIQKNLENFYAEFDEADVIYRLFAVDDPDEFIPQCAKKVYDRYGVEAYEHNGKFYQRNTYSVEISVLCMEDERKIYVRSDKMKYINIQRSLALETELLNFDGLLMHASLIDVGGKGIVFSAPSGTGKSTQASLWEKHRGAEILNGDKVAIRFIDGKWMAYGSPWAGSSGIYLNKKVEISAIVFLGQSSENVVRKIEGIKAFRAGINGGIFPYWNREKMEQACSVCQRLCFELPVFELDCRPDVSAVEELEKFI